MIKINKREAEKLANVLRQEVVEDTKSLHEHSWMQRPDEFTALARKSARWRELMRRAQRGAR